jgi:hypothetical protein
MIKRLLQVLLVLFGVVLILALRPISANDESDCNVVSGIVVKLHEGGENDIVFRLKDDKKISYINRGLEAGLTFEGLREQLLNNKVILWSAKHWTPLDPKGRMNHICKVTYKDEVIYTEFE